MLLIYDSLTGNVERFVSKLDMSKIKITENLTVDKPFVLITYTTGFGEVPKSVDLFLQRNFPLLRGVAASGNMNWGSNYCKSADVISEKYDVPVICKFELSGTSRDVKRFKQEVENIGK